MFNGIGIDQFPTDDFCKFNDLFIIASAERSAIDHVFSCYDTKVVVSVTDAIGEPISKED